MIIFECCPPFQPKPKLRPFCGGWHFIWLWFGFHYVAHTMNEFVETAVELGRQESVKASANGQSVTEGEGK